MDETHQGDIQRQGSGEQEPQNTEALRKPTPLVEYLDLWLANRGPIWLRYGVAVLAVVAALLLDEVDFLSGGFRIYLVFYPFIIIATLYGGPGPGLLAIALSCMAVSFFWAQPVGEFAIAARADRVSMALFVFGNLLFVWICERLRSAIRQAAQAEAHRKSAEELERQAELLKESEIFSASLRDSLIEHLVVIDAQGVIIAVNQSWQRFAEANGAPELATHSVGLNYLTICENAANYPHGEEAAATREGILAVLNGAQEEFSLEYPCHSPDVPRWFRLRCTRLRNTQKGVVIAHLDITKEWLVQEAFKQAKEEAESANRAKDRFLAILSHELRTPLTPALITVIAHESDAALTPEFREDLASIRRNLEMEARLIDDLLDLNRLVRGKVDLRLQPRDLQHTLQSVLKICHSDIEAKSLLVHMELTAARHNVNGDAERLQQVFWNLLRNATKFTAPGGVITVRSSNPSDGIVRVEVIDSGIGIAPEVIPRLFVAFEQGELGTNKRFGGLGLGLAICKAVVDLHGGHILAHSEGAGKGATFTVDLPLTASPVLTEESAHQVATATSWKPESGHRTPIILLVEDDVDTLRILSRLLERAGCKLTPVPSIATALAAAQAAREGTERFDLVISDLGLPDGDGRDLMRELHERDGLSGIAISGYGMEEDIEKSRAAGFAEHLTKPIQIEELQSAIARLVS